MRELNEIKESRTKLKKSQDEIKARLNHHDESKE